MFGRAAKGERGNMAVKAENGSLSTLGPMLSGV